jgi:3-hydroxyisobutyrate dehydrogenase-like beta-hydroxyacid dehydrogenase
MTDDKTAVSMIGLGAMGRALASALLAAGHPMTVWNRTPGRAEALVADGATLAPSAADAVAAGELAIVCLLDDDAVREVLGPIELAGATIVNLTNGTPAQARDTAAWVVERGGRYVDGGIMAVPPMIGGPAAFILYSGDEAAFERAEPVVRGLGRPMFVGTDAGLASLHDLALLSGMAGIFAGTRHALAMVGSEGVEPVAFATSLLVPWLEAMVAHVPEAAGQEASFASEDSNAAMQLIGLQNIITASRAQGVPDELIGHLQVELHALRGAA